MSLPSRRARRGARIRRDFGGPMPAGGCGEAGKAGSFIVAPDDDQVAFIAAVKILLKEILEVV